MLIGAFLLRYYAYPHLARAPVDQNHVTDLAATNATVLDIATLKPITTDLAVTAHTIGDVKATEDAGDNVRVWFKNTEVRSVPDGTLRSASIEHTAFGGTSGAAVAYSNAYLETTKGEPVTFQPQGLLYKFPFNAQRSTYMFWDSTAMKSYPMRFTGTRSLGGMPMLVYRSVVPDTVVGSREVPGSLFGGPKTAPSVSADVHYTNTKTMTVEPNTGAIIDRVEAQHQWLVAPDGTTVDTTKAVIHHTKGEIAQMLNQVKDDGPLLGHIHTLYPMLLSIFGLVLIAAGFAWRIFIRRKDRAVASSRTPGPREGVPPNLVSGR